MCIPKIPFSFQSVQIMLAVRCQRGWLACKCKWKPAIKSTAHTTVLYDVMVLPWHHSFESTSRKNNSFLAKESASIHWIFIEMETRTFVIICKGKNLVQWVQMLGFYNLIYSSFHRIVCFNQPCPIGTKSLASHEKQNRIQEVFSFVNNSSFHLFNLCTVDNMTILIIVLCNFHFSNVIGWIGWQYEISSDAIFHVK